MRQASSARRKFSTGTATIWTPCGSSRPRLFAIAQLAARAGRRQRDLGERASLEIIRNYPLAQNERALLLSDDRDIGRVIVGRPRPPHPAHHMGLSAPA